MKIHREINILIKSHSKYTYDILYILLKYPLAQTNTEFGERYFFSNSTEQPYSHKSYISPWRIP